MDSKPDTKTVNASKERESAIIKELKSHPEIHHNGLKRLVVPHHMATKTFDRTIRDLIERKVIYVESIGNQKHYTVTLRFPDNAVKKNISDLCHLLDDMQSRLNELKRTYQKFSKKKKEEIALDLSHVYFDTRLQVVKIFELLGKESLLGEYDAL